MENHQALHSKSRHLKLVFLVVLLVVFCVWVSATYPSNQQIADKIIEKGEDYKPPVKIMLVKSKIGLIETDKRISAGDDWLKGLTIRVRNDSDKPITGIVMIIRFHRPANQAQELDLVAPLPYGQNPFASPQEGSPIPTEPIMPGQTTDITLPDQSYDSLRSVLDKENYPANIKAVKIQVKTIGFIDGTAWNAGKIFRRNPDNPDKWIRDSQPQSRVKKGRPVH